MCKTRIYLSRLAHFLSGDSSLCSGSSSSTAGSFWSKFSSMLRALSRSDFSFSSSSKANGFSTSILAVSSCSIVSAFLVFAASSFTGIFASSFSIRIRLPSGSDVASHRSRWHIPVLDCSFDGRRGLG